MKHVEKIAATPAQTAGVSSDELKLISLNTLSFAVIALFSRSFEAPLVLGAYTAMTYVWIGLIDLAKDKRSRALAYYSNVALHAGAFLFLQQERYIGILNLENATAPATLPFLIGFAFYILQSMAIAGMVYRRQIEPLSLQRYILAISFCGAFLAGPLFNHEQIKKLRTVDVTLPSVERIHATSHLLIGGLLFKLVFANWLAQWVDIKEATSPLGIARSVLAFELQVYFDFAGYSLIALFICRCFGLPMYYNFQHPFAARDVPEFWRRWHVGLGTWFKENIFVPLRQKSSARWPAKTILPLTVFLVSAAWHGPTRNFLAWGLFHGAAFVVSVNLLSRTTHARAGRIASKVFLLLALVYGRLLFMDSDFPRLVEKFRRLGMFKRLACEAAERLPKSLDAVKTLCVTSWHDLAIGLMIAMLLAYELLLPETKRKSEPYAYFQPGVGTVIAFLVLLLFLQPLTRAGFVYGR